MLASTLSDSVSKLFGVIEAVGGFVAIVLLVFFFAGRATGRLQRPVTVAVCLGPALVLLLVGLVIPAIRTMYLSLSELRQQEGGRLQELLLGVHRPQQSQRP